MIISKVIRIVIDVIIAPFYLIHDILTFEDIPEEDFWKSTIAMQNWENQQDFDQNYVQVRCNQYWHGVLAEMQNEVDQKNRKWSDQQWQDFLKGSQ